MKTIWNVLSVMAVANVLAAIGVVGWLGASGRLSADRLDETRQMFALSIEDEKAQAEAEAERLATEQAEAAEAERMRVPPLSTEAVIEQQQDEEETMRQRLLRQEADLGAQREMLLQFQQALEERELKLAADREAFEAERRQIVELEESEQFRTALKTLEGQRPADAAKLLTSILGEGKRDIVIAYLDAMGERPRNKIIAELTKTERELAAGLLEDIRTRGMNTALGDETDVATGSSDPNPTGG